MAGMFPAFGEFSGAADLSRKGPLNDAVYLPSRYSPILSSIYTHSISWAFHGKAVLRKTDVTIIGEMNLMPVSETFKTAKLLAYL